MQTYLVATPAEVGTASGYRCPLAHAAYRIGAGSSLLRKDLLMQTQGGLLAVTGQDAPPIQDPEALCSAVLRECSRRSYTGVLLDFESAPTQDRQTFAARLGPALAHTHRTLYLPEAYAQADPTAVVTLCTAMSGGHFSDRLRETADRRGGADRIALDIQRLRMEFRLPAPTGLGTALTAQELARRMEEESPSVFFSSDLCAHYFTYMQAGEVHFVLFDDVETLRQKLRIGTELGCRAAFLLWPEVRDIADTLLRP